MSTFLQFPVAARTWGAYHQPGRADQPPGRCQAGEVLTWRHGLTGHLKLFGSQASLGKYLSHREEAAPEAA